MTSTPPAKQPAFLFGRWTGDIISGRWTPSSKGKASGSARGKGGNAAARQFGVDITSPTINRTAATSAVEPGNSAKGLVDVEKLTRLIAMREATLAADADADVRSSLMY